MARVLIVEDNFVLAQFMEAVCRKGGHEIVGVYADADSAEAALAQSCPDVMLLDYRLIGERTGVDVSVTAAKRCPQARRIFVTANTEPDNMQAMRGTEPWTILQKPVTAPALMDAISA